MNEFTDRAFAMWLPVEPGDRVAVLGDHPTLSASVQRAGGTVDVLAARDAAGDGLADLVDHLVVLDVHALLDLPRRAISRLIRPGGTIVVGCPHRHRFPWNGDARTGAQLLDTLDGWGVPDADVYLVRQSLTNPRAVVPLNADAVRWYLQTSYLPLSRPAAFAAAALRRSWTVHVALVLFPALVAVGRRPASA